jgi:hypothetical protein
MESDRLLAACVWRRQVRGELHSDDQYHVTGSLHVHHSILPSATGARLRTGRHGLQHGLRRHIGKPPDDQRIRPVGATVSAGIYVMTQHDSIPH